jgi:hypothetical protein
MEEPTGLSGHIIRLVLAWPLVWAIGSGFGYFILKPLRDAALKPPPPTQYRLPDLFVLLGVLFVAGLPFAFRAPSDERGVFAGLLFIWSLCTAWWWWGLRLLSRAAIQGRRRRTVCLGAAMPLACAGPPVWFLALQLFVPDSRPSQFWLSLAWLCGWPVLCISGRGLARWIAKDTRSSPPSSGQPGQPPSA